MSLSTTAKNQVLDSLSAQGTPTNLMANVSLHSADPGTTGASEFSGGGYAVQTMTWNVASSGSKTNSGSASFTTSGSTPATHLGTKSSGGTFGLGAALSSPVTAVTITIAAGAISLSAA